MARKLAQTLGLAAIIVGTVVAVGCHGQSSNSDAAKAAVFGQGPPMTAKDKADMEAGMKRSRLIQEGKIKPPIVHAPVPGQDGFH